MKKSLGLYPAPLKILDVSFSMTVRYADACVYLAIFMHTSPLYMKAIQLVKYAYWSKYYDELCSLWWEINLFLRVDFEFIFRTLGLSVKQILPKVDNSRKRVLFWITNVRPMQ
jgi:hypothetical protein